MSKKALLTSLLILFTAVSVAQPKLKRYEFPEFGMSIPFFSDAVKSLNNTGKISEYISYSYESSKNDKRIIGNMYLYTKAGCLPIDTFYNQMERFAALADGDPKRFRPLHQISHTQYLGWSYFDAILTIDKHPDNISRVVQAYYNGAQILLIDLISVNENTAEMEKEIFKDPGYRSILRPLELKSLGIRLKVRGNVAVRYAEKEKRYYLGRCDRFGTLYPVVTFESVSGDPSSLALNELAAQRKDLGFDNVRLETIDAADKFVKFKGGITKIIADDNREVKGRAFHYFFRFNDKTYKVSLYVPYIKDDNRVYFQSDREINAESAAEFDKRVMELLENLEKI
ncbi:MAG: hypothetical protein HUU43_11755 [Ignavibacteriaceae bacterium]|nr:hypothetical protein [Ignavibacteriaceae bacterium]